MKAELREADGCSAYPTLEIFVGGEKVGVVENRVSCFIASLDATGAVRCSMISAGETPELAIRAAIRSGRDEAAALVANTDRQEAAIFGDAK